MLRKAREWDQSLALVQAVASELPFLTASFDLVYCVNALHHFHRPAAFLSEARRIIRPGGAIAIIGMDPHRGADRWYVYDYFQGTRETDLRRYPSAPVIAEWLVGAGFTAVRWGPAARIEGVLVGREVLDSPFLRKHATSQLALLSNSQYEAGLAGIRAALVAAEAAGETVMFATDISLMLVSGYADEPLDQRRS